MLQIFGAPWVQSSNLTDELNKTLTDSGNGMYKTEFSAPERAGVYKLGISYARLGYTSISSSLGVTLRPISTREQEHFVAASYPYYLSFTLLLVAFVRFLIAFQAAPEKTGKGEKRD